MNFDDGDSVEVGLWWRTPVRVTWSGWPSGDHAAWLHDGWPQTFWKFLLVPPLFAILVFALFATVQEGVARWRRDTGPAVVNEWVLLFGGLEQGHALPSLSWLVGLRSRNGAEFGLGPNLTPAGVALALAGGVTLRSGGLNVPVTFAVVPSKAGTRISMLTGFSLRR